MARRKTVAEVSPPPPPEEVQKASRLDRFRSLVAEHHSERVNVAPPKVAPQAAEPILDFKEVRAAEEQARQSAILAGETVKASMSRLDLYRLNAERANKARQTFQASEGSKESTKPKQEPVWQPAKLGFQGQKLEPKEPEHTVEYLTDESGLVLDEQGKPIPCTYESLRLAVQADVEAGKTTVDDGRMILRAYESTAVTFREAWWLDTAEIRERLRTFKPPELSEATINALKGQAALDRSVGVLTSHAFLAEAFAQPSERAIRFRVQYADGFIREGFLEPGPRESQSAAVKRAETYVRGLLLERPSGVSGPQKSAPVGPVGDLGVDDKGPRNAIREAPSMTMAPTWGQVMGPDGWGDKILRTALIQERIKGAADLDVGRKVRIGGKMATTTPSKPRPLSEPWMRAGTTHCVDPKSASAPPRSVRLKGDRY